LGRGEGRGGTAGQIAATHTVTLTVQTALEGLERLHRTRREEVLLGVATDGYHAAVEA
jgi:hypothetical protein